MELVSKNIDQLITSGGDERLDLLDNGLNKYYLNPNDFQGLINRGSCTCNTLNSFSKPIVNQVYSDVEGGKAYNELLAEHRKRLKDLLNYEGQDKFDIIFAPSGSDLVYLPILFANMLHPNKKIMNFLTCPEELGSGSITAAEGNYYMAKNQFDEALPKTGSLKTGLNIEVIFFNARSSSGHILDHKETLKREIALHPNEAKIGSLVIGSKSGIADNLTVIDEVEEDVLWTIDLCQFRNSKKLVNELLDKGCSLMITGSKFYQAPPFCGAMLVPKPLVKRLQNCKLESTAAYLKTMFSANDFPDSLMNVKQSLRSFNNLGLQLRWEAAISEMEALNELPNEVVNGTITEWNNVVMGELSKYPYFKLMPNQKISNQTIISFRVKKDGAFLDHQALRQLYKEILVNNHTISDQFDRLCIGQPVEYMNKSFIRMALGSFNLRRLLAKPAESRFDNDKRIIELIAQKIEAL
ncbi:MAG: hypothetical protein KTR13_03715 [Saprospiraceae bacterium]|nr:hypothetical protein [Saprospiraceae bacterium]